LWSPTTALRRSPELSATWAPSPSGDFSFTIRALVLAPGAAISSHRPEGSNMGGYNKVGPGSGHGVQILLNGIISLGANNEPLPLRLRQDHSFGFRAIRSAISDRCLCPSGR